MPSATPYDHTGIEYCTLRSFPFSNGSSLPNVRVAFRSFNPKSTRGVVLIPTCFGGHINTTLSFTGSSGSGIDDSLKEYHVIVVALLGNGESSSPSNYKPLFNPQGGPLTGPDFPVPGELRYEDCVNVQHALLTYHFKIQSIEAVVGFSMGGQLAYYWAVMYPGFVKRAVIICGSARTSPHNYAFLEGPVAALANSADYVTWKRIKTKLARGDPVSETLQRLWPVRGLRAFGRAYNAWLTSATWFRERWWARPASEGGLGFASVDEYIVAMSEDGYIAWDPDDLLVMARMWQMGDVASVFIPPKAPEGAAGAEEALPKRSSLGGAVPNDERFARALRSIDAEVMIMPCRSDQYFSPHDSEIEMRYLRNGRLALIQSVWGHVAGGGVNARDIEWMNERIKKFMNQPGLG